MIQSDDLAKAATKLHIKDERHVAFGRLALHHLRTTAGPTAPYGSYAHLDNTTVSFMGQYGLRVWPAYATHRGHLTSTSTVKGGVGKGLLYAKASGLVRGDLKAWKAANDGREPTENDQLLGSPFGRLLRAYLETLVNSDAKVALVLKNEAEVDGKEQDLLKAVLC